MNKMKFLKILPIILLFSQVSSGAQFYQECKGQKFVVTIEQWNATLNVKSRNGQYRHYELQIPLAADGRDVYSGVPYILKDRTVGLNVIYRAHGNKDPLSNIIPMAAFITDDSGILLEKPIPCKSTAYLGKDQ